MIKHREGININKKASKTAGKALTALSVAVSAALIITGTLAAAAWLDKLFNALNMGEGMIAFAKKLQKLNPWINTSAALLGLTVICLWLDSRTPAKRGISALRSDLIRRPLKKLAIVFIIPIIAAFSIGFIWPFCKGFFLSFCKFKTTSNPTWTGLSNYGKALNDASFRHAFCYTSLFAVTSLVLINVFAFAVAYALTQQIKGSNIFRTVFFMPNLIGGIVLGYIWSMIFDGILSRFGTSILMNTAYGFWGLIILICWQQIGYMMIIYIAGLQAVPEDMLEAARIDGASKWQTLWKITIPNVMPSITICMFLTLTNGFKLFDQNLALNGGQPFIQNPDGTVIKTTEMLALNIFNTFYGQNTASRGVAQAKAVLFFILVAAIGLIQLSATRRKEVQQ